MERITLKAARERAGLGLRELALKSGVGQATVSRLENGVITNPQRDTEMALEQALGLERGSLVFGNERRLVPDRRERDRRTHGRGRRVMNGHLAAVVDDRRQKARRGV